MIKSLSILLASYSIAVAAGPSGLGGTPLSGSAVSSNSIVTALGYVPASSTVSGTTPAQVTNIVATLSPTNGDTRNFSFPVGTWTFTGSSYIFSTILDQALAGGSGSSFVLADSGGILYLTNLLFGTAFYSNANAFALSPTNVGTLGQVLSLTGNKTKWVDQGAGGSSDYKLNWQTQVLQFTNTTGGDLKIGSDGSSITFVQGLNEFANISGNHITWEQPATNTAALAANGGLYANTLNVSGASSFLNPVTVTGSGTNWFSYTMFTNFMGVSNVNFLAGINMNTNGDIKTTGSYYGDGSHLTGISSGVQNPMIANLDGGTFHISNLEYVNAGALYSGSNVRTENNGSFYFNGGQNGGPFIKGQEISSSASSLMIHDGPATLAVTVGGTVAATNGFITITNSAQTLSAITFPATTVKWTNNFGMNIVLYIDNSGVTGTAISKNNQQIFSSLVGDVTICLKPGDYFAVAYSVGTPSARWEPQ